MIRGTCAGVAMRTLAALAGFSATALAQQPTAFVHGFLNDGSAWQSTATYLSQQFAIQPLLPTLGWTDRFDAQVSRLDVALAGYSSIPALAHSNGGLVARRHVQLWGSSAIPNRLATIGTGHGGIWLATNVLNGNVGAWGQNIVGAIGDPFYFYSFYDPDWWWAAPIGLRNLAWNMQRFGNWIPFGVLSGVGIGASVPVSFDLPPGGNFTTALNSSGGLSTESSRLAARVGISTTTRPQNAMMRMLLSNWRTWTNVRWGLWSAALVMRTYYANHPDWFLASNAWRWELMMLRMMDLDVVWQWQIGTLEQAVCSAYWCYATVSPSDGLVPIYSQRYPAATRSIGLTDDIIHTAQKNHIAARTEFVNVFRNDFFISASTGGGGGGGDPPPCKPEPGLPCPY